MKAVGNTILYAGDNAIFGPGVAEQLIGKPVSRGIVIAAEQISPREIELTIEFPLFERRRCREYTGRMHWSFHRRDEMRWGPR